jgi:hypothetical protein
VTFTENVAVGNGNGFYVNADNFVFTGNLAAANTLSPSAFTGDGFRMASAQNAVITGNAATGNPGSGFRMGTFVGGKLTGNTARANGRYGFDMERAPSVAGNAAISNVQGGFLIRLEGVRLTQNNIFGNGTAPNHLTSEVNCGVLNATLSTVNAENNFWGAATGPGGDPADKGCVIAFGIELIDVAPYAPRAFSIPVKAGE